MSPGWPAGPPVRELELVRVRVPLLAPLASAHSPDSDEQPERDLVLVRVVGPDGVEGWGECSTLTHPTYTSEYTAGAWALLRDEIVPAVLLGEQPQVRGNHMALASVEMAIADLRARVAGRSLSRQLGGTRSRVTTCAVVGIAASPEATCERVAEALDKGFTQVKLKIRPGWSVVPLDAVRSRWPELALSADANGSFAPSPGDSALRAELDALDELRLGYLEQPFPPDDLLASAALSAGWRTPVALDESITSPSSAALAVTMGAARIINLKPSRVGGLAAAVRVAHVAVDHGAQVFVGGMLETGVGRAAALALASLEECSLPTDLGPSSWYFAQDLTESLETSAGELPVPTGPGIGVTPDPDLLDAFTVERLLISR